MLAYLQKQCVQAMCLVLSAKAMCLVCSWSNNNSVFTNRLNSLITTKLDIYLGMKKIEI